MYLPWNKSKFNTNEVIDIKYLQFRNKRYIIYTWKDIRGYTLENKG